MVLKCIREFGPSAHTVIASKTGLASGTISAITNELLEDGALEKLEQAPASGRGRPRILFGPKAGFAYFVMVRITAEHIEYSLVDYRSAMIDRQIIDRTTLHNDIDKFCTEFKRTLLEFVSRSGLTPDDIQVVSITTKGEVIEALRTLVWSPIFGDHSIDFQTLLKSTWPHEVRLTSDISFISHNVMAAADAANVISPGDQLAVLSLADSISLGIATMDARGEIGLSSPSFGHMPNSPDGPLCRCGAQGCLESYAGFYGILRTAFDAPSDVIPAKFIPLEQMRNLAASARKGDRKTIYAFRQAGIALGMCLSRMFNVLGPMPLTIVGKGLEFFDLIQEGLEQQLHQSFLVRLGQEPAIRLHTEDSEMSFDSNVSVTLREFDRDYVATRSFMQADVK